MVFCRKRKTNPKTHEEYTLFQIVEATFKASYFLIQNSITKLYSSKMLTETEIWASGMEKKVQKQIQYIQLAVFIWERDKKNNIVRKQECSHLVLYSLDAYSETQSRSLMWETGAQALESSSLPSKICICGQLEAKLMLGVPPRHTNVGYVHFNTRWNAYSLFRDFCQASRFYCSCHQEVNCEMPEKPPNAYCNKQFITICVS